MATSPTCILAYTAEDDRYRPVRMAALEMARSGPAKLIYYDIDAAPSFIGEDPLPTVWSGDGAEKEFPDRLSPADLERAGRHQIAEQVSEARDAGVQAFAWLPSSRNAAHMAEYARQQGADLILLPRELDEPSLPERLRGETAGRLEKSADVPFAIVDDDGRIEFHESQGKSQ